MSAREGLSFLQEILADMRFTSHLRGLPNCNQCGSCTSVCPAARFSGERYNPRLIVKRVLEEDRSVIEDPVIWNCFYCYSCHMRCPQQVSPCTLIQVLRELAILGRHADGEMAGFLDYAECFWEFAIGSTPNQFFADVADEWGPRWRQMRREMDAIRERLGLMAAIPPDEAIDQCQHIMRETGFRERLEILRDAHRRKQRGEL
ncbi:MAG: 4Fe-4S dicluster domain-containing protein [Candidatus Methylomirabilia bacterium]